MSTAKLRTAVVAAAFVIAGCGATADSTPTSDLEAQAAAHEKIVIELQGEVTTAQDETSSVKDELDETKVMLVAAETALDESEKKLEAKNVVISRLNDRVSDAESEVEEIREEFDPQIRAEKEAAEREAAEKKAEAERRAAMSETDRLNEECSLVEPDQLQRDPDATKGECYLLIAKASQWDGATGPCSFLANYDRKSHDYSYEYAGDSGIFVADEPCDMFDGMDVDDTMKLWVYNAGVFTYDTQIGGSNTTVAFSVRAAELVRKG